MVFRPRGGVFAGLTDPRVLPLRVRRLPWVPPRHGSWDRGDRLAPIWNTLLEIKLLLAGDGSCGRGLLLLLLLLLHVLRRPRHCGLRAREHQRQATEVLDDERDVVKTSRPLVPLARVPVTALHPVDDALRNNPQVPARLHLECHQASNVLVDLLRSAGPGLISFVEAVGHEDEEAVKGLEVDGWMVEVWLCRAWITRGMAAKRKLINLVTKNNI